jgi:hypothetical protein
LKGAENKSELRKGGGTRMIQENDQRKEDKSRGEKSAGMKSSWELEAQKVLSC